jgi:DNA repair protein RecO (recombination protein O)
MPSPGPTYITPALVLRVSDFGESDRIVTLLTEHHGKVQALARGAKNSRRRFGAALGMFGCGEAVLRERRDLWLLQELHSHRGFLRLGQELGRFGHASYACELCQHLCPPHAPEPAVFQLLLALLDRLDRLPLSERPAVEPLRTFELRILSAVGLGLSLRSCATCGSEVAANAYVPFDVPRGGVHCPDTCFGGPTPTELGLIFSGLSGGLPEAVRVALIALSESSLQEPPTAISSSVLAACRDVLLAALRHHLGRDLRAVEFISKLNRSLLT